MCVPQKATEIPKDGFLEHLVAVAEAVRGLPTDERQVLTPPEVYANLLSTRSVTGVEVKSKNHKGVGLGRKTSNQTVGHKRTPRTERTNNIPAQNDTQGGEQAKHR